MRSIAYAFEFRASTAVLCLWDWGGEEAPALRGRGETAEGGVATNATEERRADCGELFCCKLEGRAMQAGRQAVDVCGEKEFAPCFFGFFFADDAVR